MELNVSVLNDRILERLAELHLAQSQSPWFWDFLPVLPGIAVSVFAVWAVHQLTRRRERERAVFRVYRALGEMVDKASDSAALRWLTEDEVQRKRYIAETIWRINQIGLVSEQLRQISSDWRIRPTLSGPPIINCPINIRSSVIELRQALTSDPFADDKSGPDSKKFVEVEQVKGIFLSGLTHAIGNWERSIPCD